MVSNDIQAEVDSWKKLPPPGLPELGGTPVEIPIAEALISQHGILQQPLRLVGIRFANTGRLVDFNAHDFTLKVDDPVVVEAPEKGIMFGWVSRPPMTIENEDLKLNLPAILRIANEDDQQTQAKVTAQGNDAVMRTQATADKYRLPMKVLRVDFTLDLRRAIVYFSSEERVNFRDLLRELVHLLRARVDLRQVGARDQTKLIGGIGPCGEELCCSRFLNKFHNVTIKMAKDQELSLKPTKVTGVCGRLKCCLAYEEEVYVQARKEVPKKGKCVSCKSGCGIVKDVNYISRKVTVQMDDGGIQILSASEVVEEKTLRGGNPYHDEERVGSRDQGEDDAAERDLKKLED
jgi:cell fate regulator YaaT (PSP1 superfamily)